MNEAIVLIGGNGVDADALSHLSLSSAKQLLIGMAPGDRILLHVNAVMPANLNDALLRFAEVPGVTAVTVLAIF